MPIPATGGNQSGASKKGSTGGSVVELVLSARNETNESFDKLQASLEKAKKNTEVLSDKFEDLEDTSTDAFKSIRQNALDFSQEILPKLQQGIQLTAKGFQTFITIADKSLGVFNGIFEAIDNIYEIATSDVSSAFFGSLVASANQAIARVDSLSNIINALREPSVNLSKGIGGASAIDGIFNKLRAISPLLDSIDTSFGKTVKGIREGSGYAAQGLSALTDGIGAISNVQAPLAMFSGLQETIGNTINVVSEVSQRVFFFMGALDQLKGVVLGGPFDLLIGQNVRLQEQLLGIQSTLAATTTLLRGTQEIGAGGQVTEKILSLSAPVNDVLAKIRQDSLEVVGVTSNELVDVFDIITQNLTDVNISLKEAGDLTISFAASLGTIGVPLYQARQEIQSILTGQIDQNSVLAKSIGLTNAQLKSWIAQDKVYERLTERLSAFKEGNALAAQTIGGLTSNIREIADEIGRASGAEFLSPIVAQVGEVYRFLLKNQSAITDAVSDFLDRFAAVAGKVKDGIVGLGTALAPLSKEIGRLFSETIIDVIGGIGDGLKTITAVAEPFLAILGQIAKVVASTPLVSLYAQMKVISGAFGIATRFAGSFASVLPVVGQGLGLLQIRNLPVINSFSNLSAAFNGNIAAAVTLGASLTRIPGVMNMMSGVVQKNVLGFGELVASGQKLANIPIAASIAKNGAVMQMLAAGTVAATPALLNFAKTGLALAKNFNFGREEIGQFTAKLPGLISFLASASSKIPGVGAQISGLIGGLATKYDAEIKTIAASGVEVFDTIDQQIQETTSSAGAKVKELIATNTMWALSAFLVGNAFNELIIKNETLGLAITFLSDKLKEFAELISNALTSPLGILASAVLGVTIAIKTGLIAQLKNMAVATATAISPQLIPAIKGLIGFLRGADKAFLGFIGRIKDAAKEQKELAKVIDTTNGSSLSLVPYQGQKKADAIDPVPGSGSTSIVPYQGKKKKPRVGELGDGIADVTLERKNRLRDAKALLDKEKTALIPYTGVQSNLFSEEAINKSRKSIGQLFTELSEGAKRFASQVKTNLIGGFDSFNGSIKKAGESLRKIDLSGMAQSFKNVGKSLKTELQIGLTTARASAIELATSLRAGVQAGITAAGAGLTALGQAAVSAGVAVKALLIEFAPLIAIGAAIGVVVTALTNWAAGEARKNAGIKEYNERLKETITSLEEIKRLSEETEPPESRLTPETGDELQARDIAGDSGVRKLRALREGRNFFEWAGERISTGLGGGDIRSIQNDVISAQRSTDAIEAELADRLASDPFAKDGSGLNPEVMAEIRRNQELAAEIALLNKQGKDDQARLKQGELESSSRRLSDLEKRFADNKEYLKGLDLSGEDAQRRDAVVDKLSAALNLLAGAMEGTISPMKMIEQGTGTALNLTQFNQAKIQFAREGDPSQMERYANLLMGSAGDLVQQGQLDPEEAIEAVRKIAESTGLDAKTTKAAQEQMAQFWEIATKRILQSEENRQSGLDLLRQKGQVSERQYLEESLSILETRLQKQKEMSLKGQQQEIEVIKVQEREQLRVIRQQLKAQEETLMESINNTNSPEDKKKLTDNLNAARQEAGRQEAEIIKATQDEIRQLRLDYESEYTAMMIAAEKERQEARIKIVQQMQDKLNDQLAYSEEMRNQNLTRLMNERLIFEEEANLIRTESTDRRLAREIEAEKALRDERMKTPALFESEIRKSDVKIAQLTQQRIENEGKAWDAQIAALRRNLKYRVDLFVNAIEEENKAILGQQKYIEAMQNTLNTRNEVLGGAKGIVDETAESIAGSYKAVGSGTLSENTQRVMNNVAEIAKLETLQKSVELEKQMFETQLAQNRLALERQEIELKLKEIEEQRLLMEKKAALEVAKKAYEEKPGDQQAKLDYERAQRELELQSASFGLTRKEIEMNQKQQILADATYDIQIRNKERELQTQIAEQQAVVAEGGNPLQQYEMRVQSKITSLMSAFELSLKDAERLARDEDALYSFAREAQANGVANVFPQLRGMGFSFNDYTSNRGAQQTAILNAGARFGATSIPSMAEASSGYDAAYGGAIPANPEQSEVGATFDEVDAILDKIDLLDETVTDLGKGAIPTMEEMTASAAALIEEQFPAFKEAMDEVNADKLPTATSVLDELGARLQTFSEEDLPGMSEALTGVQDTAIMSIDTIVLKLEEETTSLTEAIAKQFETVWQGIMETIVLPPSGKLPEEPKPEEQPVGLTPEQQAEKTTYDIESKEAQIRGNEDRIRELSRLNSQTVSPLFSLRPYGEVSREIDQRTTQINLIKEQNEKLQEEIKTLRERQTTLPAFAPTQPSGNGSPGWLKRLTGGNDRAQASKTFTANITVAANTAADARKIGSEVASFMRDVFYKTGEVTA